MGGPFFRQQNLLKVNFREAENLCKINNKYKGGNAPNILKAYNKYIKKDLNSVVLFFMLLILNRFRASF